MANNLLKNNFKIPAQFVMKTFTAYSTLFNYGIASSLPQHASLPVIGTEQASGE